MEFRNIFTLNDWKFKEFAAVIILIQVLMWVVGFFLLQPNAYTNI